jgi:surfactin synthase thioesterase subunit
LADVWAMRLPGRESRIRDASHASVESIVEEAVRNLPNPADRRLVIFGHCLGGLIALETARKLRQESVAVSLLIIVSQMAPSYVASQPPAEPTDIRRDAKRLGLVSEEILAHPELFELLLPALAADIAAADGYAYVHGTTIDVPIIVLAGNEDNTVVSEGLADWQSLTTRTASVRTIQGDHLFSGAYWPELGATVRDLLRAG